LGYDIDATKDTTMRINLKGLAGTVAAECGDKGAVVISYGEGGSVRIGVENLTPQELRQALCTAVYYSFVFEKDGKIEET
jgi:hypothetical protein